MVIGNFKYISERKYCGSIHTLLFSHPRVTVCRIDDVEGKRPGRFEVVSCADDGTTTEIGIAYPDSYASDGLIVFLNGPCCEGFYATLQLVCDEDDAMVLEWEPVCDIEESG